MHSPLFHLEALLDRAQEKLTLSELEDLASLTDRAADESRRMAEVCEMVGCLIDRDVSASGAKGGYFEKGNDVATLVFSMASSFESIAALVAVGDSARHFATERKLREGQVVTAATVSQLAPGDRVRTVIAGRQGTVVKVYADGSACVRYDDGTPQPEGLGHERVPRVFLQRETET